LEQATALFLIRFPVLSFALAGLRRAKLKKLTPCFFYTDEHLKLP
jgi:hypothetical protein